VKLGNIAEIIAGQPAGKDNLVDNGDIRYVSAKDITLFCRGSCFTKDSEVRLQSRSSRS